MQKKILCLVIALSAVTGAYAQSSSMLSGGVRVGSMSYICSGSDIHAKLGWATDLDFGYTAFWNVYPVELGVHTGASLGFCGNRFTSQVNQQQFTNTDYLNYRTIYTVSANSIELKVSPQIQIEIPIMCALRVKNIFVNAGAKIMVPIYDRCRQNVSDVTIDAYYEKADVHLVNRLITGVADASQLNWTGKGCLPKFNLLLGFEAGYEWEFLQTHRVGLGLYADISPYSNYKTSAKSGIIDVAPIENPTYPPAQVTVHPLCNAVDRRLLFYDFGIKCYYGFNLRGRYR